MIVKKEKLIILWYNKYYIKGGIFMQNGDINSYKKIDERYYIKLNNIIKTLLIVCLIFTLTYLFVYVLTVLMQNLLLKLYYPSRSGDNKVFVVPIINFVKIAIFCIVFITISIIFLKSNLGNNQKVTFEIISIIIGLLFLINAIPLLSYFENRFYSKLDVRYYFNYVTIINFLSNFECLLRVGAISFIISHVISLVKKTILKYES